MAGTTGPRFYQGMSFCDQRSDRQFGRFAVLPFQALAGRCLTRLIGMAPLMLMLASCGTPPFNVQRGKIPETMLKEDAAYTERLLRSEVDSPDASLKEFD